MEIVKGRHRGWEKRINCPNCWAQLNLKARDVEPLQVRHGIWQYYTTCPECDTRCHLSSEHLGMSPLQLKHLHNLNYEDI